MSEPLRPNDPIHAIPSFKTDQIHSIDTTKDFEDPFSDLNLFLSRKIKGLIQDIALSGKWSAKVETRLLTKILPEFKKQFPKYELGVCAFKKAWAKVTDYYEKVQKQKGSFDKNGSLNLKVMIRENLKNAQISSRLTPYTVAQEMAVKLSKCIASLEGKKLECDHLAKIIWAVQKHLLKDLSAMEAKNPYEEYDFLDKLIVKVQLEIIAKNQHLNFPALKKEIFKHLKEYANVQTLFEKNQLNSTLSLILSQHLFSAPIINYHFSLEEKGGILTFIQHQVKLGKSTQLLKKGEHPLELIQRILALCVIVQELPIGMTEESLRLSIEKIKTFKGEKGSLLSEVDPTLHLFINAQMHLMGAGKRLGREEEKGLIHAYQNACAFPRLTPFQLEHLELFIWKVIGEAEDLLSDIPINLLNLLHKEIGNVLIDYPDQPFGVIMNQTLQFLKKCIALPMEKKKVKHKVEIWSMQNEMLIRSIHFDCKRPLLKLIEKTWKNQNLRRTTVQHEGFIREIEQEALRLFPVLVSFQKELRSRLWILYKYFWYHLPLTQSESTYEKFLLWHWISLKNTHPKWSEKKCNQALAKLSNQLIPLAPYKTL